MGPPGQDNANSVVLDKPEIVTIGLPSASSTTFSGQVKFDDMALK